MSNYPRISNPLDLDEREQKLFDEHLRIVRIAVGRYGRFISTSWRDDLRQYALVALVKAAKAADPNHPLPFVCYAWDAVRNAARNFVFSPGHRFGNHALRNAARFERSADEVIGSHEGTEFTRGETADNANGVAEEQANYASDHLAARRCEIRGVIQSLDELTSFERHVLKLRFIEGLSVEEVVRKTERSKPMVGRAIKSGVRKLRAHFTGQGLETLPLDAPIPRVDYEQAPGARQKAA
jgi:RNA polymerase sigma factor (sigma-70 family)